MRNHFRKYNDICDKIEELNYKKEELKENLYSVSGINYDKLPSASNSTGDSLLYKIQEIDEINEELDNLELIKNEMIATYEEEISRLESDKERKMLRSYFILRMNMNVIAEMMNVTINHAYKIRKKGIINFKKMIINDNK